MSELLTLSLRVSPANPQGKITLATCIHDLILSVTRVQDPEILELLRLGQQLAPNLEGAILH